MPKSYLAEDASLSGADVAHSGALGNMGIATMADFAKAFKLC